MSFFECVKTVTIFPIRITNHYFSCSKKYLLAAPHCTICKSQQTHPVTLDSGIQCNNSGGDGGSEETETHEND